MEEPDPEQLARTTQVLWAALLASQLVYVGILLSGMLDVPDEPGVSSTFPAVLAAVAIPLAAAAHFFWRRASGAGLSLHDSRPEPEAAFQGYVIAWVLDESVAILGLVLGMLGFGMAIWAPFQVGAFLLMLLHRQAQSP